jgi:hypothetical protein
VPFKYHSRQDVLHGTLTDMNGQQRLLGILIVAVVVVLFLAFPRYEVHVEGARLYKIDRWTGQVTRVRPDPAP